MYEVRNAQTAEIYATFLAAKHALDYCKQSLGARMSVHGLSGWMSDDSLIMIVWVG